MKNEKKYYIMVEWELVQFLRITHPMETNEKKTIHTGALLLKFI